MNRNLHIWCSAWKRGVGAKISLPLVAALLLLPGCTPDLRETVGPTIPFPNVQGRIVRSGQPLPDHEIDLEETDSGLKVEDVRTDAEGAYHLSRVDSGAWTLSIRSEYPGDFEKVTWEFQIFDPDTIVRAPVIDISTGGLQLEHPAADSLLPRPSFLRPVVFSWSRNDGDDREVQVRLYLDDGEPVWYGETTSGDESRWNGLGNRGSWQGRLIEPGTYTWKIRVEDEMDVEYNSVSRHLSFEE